MAKIYNPNEALMKDANKATACGLSYGDWRAKGCPGPTGEKTEKIKCYRKFRRNRTKTR